MTDCVNLFHAEQFLVRSIGPRLQVRFSFIVAGQRYDHAKILIPSGPNASYWSSIREGSQIEVAYNPIDPTNAYVVKQSKWLVAMVWIVAVAFTAGWICHVAFSIRAALNKS